MIMTDKLEKSDGLPNDSFLIPIWQILTFGKVENFTLICFRYSHFFVFHCALSSPFLGFHHLILSIILVVQDSQWHHG